MNLWDDDVPRCKYCGCVITEGYCCDACYRDFDDDSAYDDEDYNYYDDTYDDESEDEDE